MEGALEVFDGSSRKSYAYSAHPSGVSSEIWYYASLMVHGDDLLNEMNKDLAQQQKTAM